MRARWVIVLLVACSRPESTRLKSPPLAFEASVADCADGEDNDGDTEVDCADPECAVFCTPLTESHCHDLKDDDGDGYTDCQDPDCGALEGCGSETSDAECLDGADNDGDGLRDCADPNCQHSTDVAYCDGEVIEVEVRCQASATQGCDDAEDPENGACADALDNDGAVDCADPDCWAQPVCGPEEGAWCDDGRDNDANGLVDCADPWCGLSITGHCEGFAIALTDADGDWVPDELDAVSLTANDDDRDQDGVPNGTDADDDNDGICDARPASRCTFLDGAELDPCPWAPGWAVGAGQPFEACDFDVDGDTWANPFDNCPFIANPTQDDTDADGIGDVCAVPPFPAPAACSDPENGGQEGCDLVIEEVLYHLSSASWHIADANRDGHADTREDEFVELFNVSGQALDVSGTLLYDQDSLAAGIPRHEVPPGTLLRPGQTLVVFGGGSPSRSSVVTLVQVASSGSLGLANRTDQLHVYSRRGTLLARLTYGTDTSLSAPPNVSLTRYPSGTRFWMPHPGVPGEAAFSPGWPAD